MEVIYHLDSLLTTCFKIIAEAEERGMKIKKIYLDPSEWEQFCRELDSFNVMTNKTAQPEKTEKKLQATYYGVTIERRIS